MSTDSSSQSSFLLEICQSLFCQFMIFYLKQFVCCQKAANCQKAENPHFSWDANNIVSGIITTLQIIDFFILNIRSLRMYFLIVKTLIYEILMLNMYFIYLDAIVAKIVIIYIYSMSNKNSSFTRPQAVIVVEEPIFSGICYFH